MARRIDTRLSGLRIVLCSLTLLGGALIIWGVILLVLGLLQSPDQCRGAECPPGESMNWLYFFFGFPGFLMLVTAVSQWDERDLPWKGYAALAVSGMVVGGFTVWPFIGWLRGDLLVTAWQTPPDRPASIRAAGVWAAGSTVVRARYDRLVAYDVADRQVAWQHEFPGRQELCSMSRTVSDGVGLVGRAEAGRPCATLTAVEVRTGRMLWSRTLKMPGAHRTGPAPDSVAATGRVAVAVDARGVAAFDLRTGRPRWTLRERDCRPLSLEAAKTRIGLLMQCRTEGVRALALHLETGSVQWRAPISPLPADQIEALDLLAMDPMVVHVKEKGTRGTDALLSLDEHGKRQAIIPVSDSYGDIDPHTFYSDDGKFGARPLRSVVVTDELLLAVTDKPENAWQDSLSAFSLRDGHLVWQWTSEEQEDICGIRTGHTLTVAACSSNDRILRLKPLSPATGKSVGDPIVHDRGESGHVGIAEIITVGDLITVVPADATGATSPVTVLRPK